jgi:hypothetical protein
MRRRVCEGCGNDCPGGVLATLIGMFPGWHGWVGVNEKLYARKTG